MVEVPVPVPYHPNLDLVDLECAKSGLLKTPQTLAPQNTPDYWGLHVPVGIGKGRGRGQKSRGGPNVPPVRLSVPTVLPHPLEVFPASGVRPLTVRDPRPLTRTSTTE